MSKFARSVRLSIKNLYIRIEYTCTSEENTLLVSRVRYASAKRCTVRGYPLRDFHSAAIVINIRVLRASRTDRRRDPAYVKRDSTSGTHPARRLFTPVAASSASSLPLPLHRKEVNRDVIVSWPRWRYRCTHRERRYRWLVAPIFQPRNSPDAARGENERKRNRVSLRLRLRDEAGLPCEGFLTSCRRKCDADPAARISASHLWEFSFSFLSALLFRSSFLRIIYLAVDPSQGRTLDCIAKMPSRGFSGEWPRFIEVESILDCIVICRMQLINIITCVFII